MHAASSAEDLNITSISPTSLTFITPPVATATATNENFSLTINNATSSFQVNYTLAATPSLVDVQGDFPMSEEELVMPATAAVPLTIIGDGFGEDPGCITVSHHQHTLLCEGPMSTFIVHTTSPKDALHSSALVVIKGYRPEEWRHMHSSTVE